MPALLFVFIVSFQKDCIHRISEKGHINSTEKESSLGVQKQCPKNKHIKITIPTSMIFSFKEKSEKKINIAYSVQKISFIGKIEKVHSN